MADFWFRFVLQLILTRLTYLYEQWFVKIDPIRHF